jgi:hypothetical protein
MLVLRSCLSLSAAAAGELGLSASSSNRGLLMKGSHANRKATTDEMAYATQVIQEAYPE